MRNYIVNRILLCLISFVLSSNLLCQHWYGETTEEYSGLNFIRDTCLLEKDSIKMIEITDLYWVFQPFSDTTANKTYYLDFKKIDSVKIQYGGYYGRGKFKSHKICYLLDEHSDQFEIEYSSEKKASVDQNRLKHLILTFLYLDLKEFKNSEGTIRITSHSNDTILTVYYSYSDDSVFQETIIIYSKKIVSCNMEYGVP